MAVPCKTVNLRIRHAIQSGKVWMQRSVFRQPPHGHGERRSRLLIHHAKVLTDLALDVVEEGGAGLAVKPWQTRPSMRKTSMAGRALDLKPSSRHAYGMLGCQLMAKCLHW